MKRLFYGWNTARLIRLLIGVGLGIYAFIEGDYLFLLLGGVFIMQSLLNVSCCGAAGCSADKGGRREEAYKGQIKRYGE